MTRRGDDLMHLLRNLLRASEATAAAYETAKRSTVVNRPDAARFASYVSSERAFARNLRAALGVPLADGPKKGTETGDLSTDATLAASAFVGFRALYRTESHRAMLVAHAFCELQRDDEICSLLANALTDARHRESWLSRKAHEPGATGVSPRARLPGALKGWMVGIAMVILVGFITALFVTHRSPTGHPSLFQAHPAVAAAGSSLV